MDQAENDIVSGEKGDTWSLYRDGASKARNGNGLPVLVLGWNRIVSAALIAVVESDRNGKKLFPMWMRWRRVRLNGTPG